MVKYLENIKELTPSFLFFEIVYIPRMENYLVDLLLRLAITKFLEIH